MTELEIFLWATLQNVKTVIMDSGASTDKDWLILHITDQAIEQYEKKLRQQNQEQLGKRPRKQGEQS